MCVLDILLMDNFVSKGWIEKGNLTTSIFILQKKDIHLILSNRF